MSRDERRASVAAAAVPLVREHGRAVTTRQIAEAAGVAEGTLFRVFADKNDILRAVVEYACRPEPMLTELDRLDTEAPLAEFMTRLVEITRRRVAEIFDVAHAARWIPEAARQPRVERDAVELRVVERLDHYSDELSVSAETAAEVLRLLVFASTHPLINEGRPLETADMVTVLLNGVRGQGTETLPVDFEIGRVDAEGRPATGTRPSTPGAEDPC